VQGYLEKKGKRVMEKLQSDNETNLHSRHAAGLFIYSGGLPMKYSSLTAGIKHESIWPNRLSTTSLPSVCGKLAICSIKQIPPCSSDDPLDDLDY